MWTLTPPSSSFLLTSMLSCFSCTHENLRRLVRMCIFTIVKIHITKWHKRHSQDAWPTMKMQELFGCRPETQLQYNLMISTDSHQPLSTYCRNISKLQLDSSKLARDTCAAHALSCYQKSCDTFVLKNAWTSTSQNHEMLRPNSHACLQAKMNLL